MTRFISNKTVAHFDLICLITYFSLNFTNFIKTDLHFSKKTVTRFIYKFRKFYQNRSTFFEKTVTRFISKTCFNISTSLPDHFDLICLSIYCSLHFDWLARSCRPCLPDQLSRFVFRPICLITSTLFAWASISRYISTNLPGHVDLIYHINYPVSYFDQFAWSLRPYLPGHLFLVTFRP